MEQEIKQLKDKIYQFKSKIKYQLDEEELLIIKRAEEETMTNYEVDNENYIRVSWLVGIIDDLLYNIKDLEEQKEDVENYYQDNWKPAYKDDYEYYGVNPKDFYE